jgi:hypothetical protein
MKLVKLCTRVESFELSKADLLTGIIYFDFGDYQFPEIEWNDFIVVILNWWLLTLSEIMSEESIEVELRFMDGPFYVKVSPTTNGLWDIRCMRGEGNLSYRGEFDAYTFVNSISEIARKIIVICNENRWEPNDIDALKLSYENIMNKISEFKFRNRGGRVIDF